MVALSEIQGPSQPAGALPSAARLKRVVVKLGTGILTAEGGRIDTARIAGFCAQLAALRALPNCRLARMSGSVATCFGIFATAAQAAAAAASITRPGWWRWGGGLYEPSPQDL